MNARSPFHAARTVQTLNPTPLRITDGLLGRIEFPKLTGRVFQLTVEVRVTPDVITGMYSFIIM